MLLSERSRPGSRVGSARGSRPSSSGRTRSGKQRPNSAPTSYSEHKCRFGLHYEGFQRKGNAAAFLGLKIEGKSMLKPAVSQLSMKHKLVRNNQWNVTQSNFKKNNGKRIQILSRPIKVFDPRRKFSEPMEQQFNLDNNDLNAQHRDLAYTSGDGMENFIFQQESIEDKMNRSLLNDSLSDYNSDHDIRSYELGLSPVKSQRNNGSNSNSDYEHPNIDYERKSNDGSDGSIISLGARIQMVAVLQRKENTHQETENTNLDLHQNHLPNAYIDEELDINHEPVLDFQNSDWRDLLRRNNELLAKLSKEHGSEKRKDVSDNYDDILTDQSYSSSLTSTDYKNSKEQFENRDHDDSCSKILYPSQKQLRPITPVTPDCFLEDIDEESSVLSEANSVADTKSEDVRKYEGISDHDIVKNNEISIQNCTINIDKMENCDKDSSSLFSSDLTRKSSFPIINSLDDIVQIPSRNEFLSQKNAIAKQLRRNSQRKKESNILCNEYSDSGRFSSDVEDNNTSTQLISNCDDETIQEHCDKAVPKEPKDNSDEAAERTLLDILEEMDDHSETILREWNTSFSQDERQKALQLVSNSHDRFLKIRILEKDIPCRIKWEELHKSCRDELETHKRDSESRTQKNSELIRQLLDDKKKLTETCEEKTKEISRIETLHSVKLKRMKEIHEKDLEDSKQKLMSAEQLKRERWTQQKTKSIKESSFRGLETRIKDLMSKHRDEVSEMKAKHWEMMRRVEEKNTVALREQEENIRRKMEEEKEEACRREREREQQRLELELRHSSQVAKDQNLSLLKSHEKEMRQLRDNFERSLMLGNKDHEAALRQNREEKEEVERSLLVKIREMEIKNKESLQLQIMTHHNDSLKLREEMNRETEEKLKNMEKMMTDKMKKQRDREIEKIIKELQSKAKSDVESKMEDAETRYRNLRSWCDAEVSAAQRGEHALRERLLDARAKAAHCEEEAVYLRSRLKAQHQELCTLQQMVQSAEDSDTFGS